MLFTPEAPFTLQAKVPVLWLLKVSVAVPTSVRRTRVGSNAAFCRLRHDVHHVSDNAAFSAHLRAASITLRIFCAR